VEGHAVDAAAGSGAGAPSAARGSAPAKPPAELNAIALLWGAAKRWLAGLFGHRA
jgi:hypothetical protein